MAEFDISNKLISLTKMILEGTNSRVTIRIKLSEPFDIELGLRQRDNFATLLFNLILEAAVRATNIDISSTIVTKSSQLPRFADDLDVIFSNLLGNRCY